MESITVIKESSQYKPSFNITDLAGDKRCDCGQSITLGFPCVHLLCATKHRKVSLSMKDVNPRFLFTTEQTPEIPVEKYPTKVPIQRIQTKDEKDLDTSNECFLDLNLLLCILDPWIDEIASEPLSSIKDILCACQVEFKEIFHTIRNTKDKNAGKALLALLQSKRADIEKANQHSSMDDLDAIGFAVLKEKPERNQSKKVDRHTNIKVDQNAHSPLKT